MNFIYCITYNMYGFAISETDVFRLTPSHQCCQMSQRPLGLLSLKQDLPLKMSPLCQSLLTLQVLSLSQCQVMLYRTDWPIR